MAVILGLYIVRPRRDSEHGDDKTYNMKLLGIQTRFVQWFQSHGGKMHERLDLVYTDAYGHALSIRPIDSLVDGQQVQLKEGTELLDIPFNLHLTPETVRAALHQSYKERRDTARYDEDFELLSDFAVLAVALMFNRCQPSSFSATTYMLFFTPYIDLLWGSQVEEWGEAANSKITSHFMIIPVLSSFTDDEIALLDDESLAYMGREEKRMRQSEWAIVSKMMAIETNCWTKEMYEYSYALVTSHCSFLFNGNRHAQEQQQAKVALVPMADMINHAPRFGNPRSFHEYHILKDREKETASHTFFSATLSTSSGLVVKADRNLSEWVWEEYNKLDNSLYLLQFGFCPIDNPYHCVMLNINDGGDEFCVGRNGSLPLEQVEETEFHVVAIRTAALKEIRAKSSGTSIERDMALLHDLELAQDTRPQKILSLRYRIEDKKLLQHLSELQ